MNTPSGGLRINGKEFPSGAELPERYRKQLVASARPKDPGSGSPDLVPNVGRTPVPHVVSFRGIVTSLSRAYRDSDEALRHSVENAHAMLNDPVISGPLLSRQMMTALLNWSIESEDDKDPKLKAVAKELTGIVERTPHFTEYRRCLLESIWYGRYAIQNAYGFHTDRHGRKRRIIRKWVPASGDKLLFRYDDGTGDYDPDQIGIRVSAAITKNDHIAGPRELEATGEGLGYFLQPWERRMWVLHKHMIRDGEYEDPLSAGQIHGVGLRHFLYWVWYQKQETLAQIAELIDRTGMGFTIYFYPSGNDAARQEVEKISREQAHTNVITMPTDPTDPNAYRIEQIPPNTQGLDVLRTLVEEYFDDQVIRFILGQTLSSRTSATGMNSGVADLQKDTLNHIVRNDAVNLEETLTREFLTTLRNINFPKYRNVDFRFKISTKSSAPQEELSALSQLWAMGAEIKVSDIYDRLDLSMPDSDDKTLFNPAIVMQMNQMKQQEEGGAPPPPSMGDDGASLMPPAPPGLPPQQLDKEADEALEKEKIFGPVLYKKLRESIAEAAAQTMRNPTEGQREAGNYQKGKFWWNGLEIAIENAKGTKRRPEWKPLPAHYGYVKKTLGKDGDHVDVFIGPHPESELVFVIDQLTDGGRFDEHKAVVGVRSLQEARDLYRSAYTSGWKVGTITPLTIGQFRTWLDVGDTTKPIAQQLKVQYEKAGYFTEGATRTDPLFPEEPADQNAKGGYFITSDASHHQETPERFVDTERYAESEKYAEGKWVPYTGPKGGRGWKNVETGEIIYGGNMPSERKPAAPEREDLVASLKAQNRDESGFVDSDGFSEDLISAVEDALGQGKSVTLVADDGAKRVPITKIHRGMMMDDKGQRWGDMGLLNGTLSLDISGDGKDPPRTADPVKKSSALGDKLGKLPEGTEIAGWTKKPIPEMNMSIWTNGEQALTDAQMAKFNRDDVRAHFSQKPADAGSQASSPRSSGRKEPREFSSSEMEIVSDVARVFGIAPGYFKNQQQIRNFLRRTAKNVGFDPTSVGSDLNEQAMASAVYLQKQKQNLDGIVEMAKRYGWSGGKAQELVTRSRGAADFLLHEAIRQGHEVTGDTPQEQMANGLEFLRQRESESEEQPDIVGKILGALTQKPAKIGIGHVVGALVGFWAAYSLIRRRQR